MNTKKIIIIALGLLLIISVFFIVTTKKSSPVASLDLNLPTLEENEAANFVTYSGAITMILMSGDKIYYYYKDSVKNGKIVDFATFRPILLEKKKNTNPQDLVVFIKPAKTSTYQNTIDAVDEMAINKIKRYVMAKISDEEQQIVDALKK